MGHSKLLLLQQITVFFFKDLFLPLLGLRKVLESGFEFGTPVAHDLFLNDICCTSGLCGSLMVPYLHMFHAIFQFCA